jgi:hypothetical protein
MLKHWTFATALLFSSASALAQGGEWNSYDDGLNANSSLDITVSSDGFSSGTNFYNDEDVKLNNHTSYDILNSYDRLNLSLNDSLDQPPQQQFLRLAAADMQGGAMSESSEKKPEYKDRWFTANKTHMYLGLGSLAAATVAALLPKEENGAHHEFGQAAAVLGGAAVATGLVFHYNDLSFENAFSNPDNLHAMLGLLGTLGYAIAVNEAPDPHAGYGIGGIVLMAAAIKVTW